MRAHQIENYIIVNTIEVIDISVLPGLVDASIGGSIGDGYVDGIVVPKVPPPTPVPESIAMWQAREELIDRDLLSLVMTVLNAIEDPIKKAKALARFEYSSTVRRDDALLTEVLPVLGFSTEQTDDMFISASKRK